MLTPPCVPSLLTGAADPVALVTQRGTVGKAAGTHGYNEKPEGLYVPVSGTDYSMPCPLSHEMGPAAVETAHYKAHSKDHWIIIYVCSDKNQCPSAAAWSRLLS